MTVIICVTPSWQRWKSLSSGSSAALLKVGDSNHQLRRPPPPVSTCFLRVESMNSFISCINIHSINFGWKPGRLSAVSNFPNCTTNCGETQSLVMQSSMIQSSLSHFSSLLPHSQFQRWLVLKWPCYFWARWWYSLSYCCPLQLKDAPQRAWIL